MFAYLYTYYSSVAIVLLAFIAVTVIYYRFRSREGFQTSTNGTLKNSAKCSMMNLVLDGARKNLQKAKDGGDQSSIKLLQTSLDSIEAEMKGMSCS